MSCLCSILQIHSLLISPGGEIFLKSFLAPDLPSQASLGTADYQTGWRSSLRPSPIPEFSEAPWSCRPAPATAGSDFLKTGAPFCVAPHLKIRFKGFLFRSALCSHSAPGICSLLQSGNTKIVLCSLRILSHFPKSFENIQHVYIPQTDRQRQPERADWKGTDFRKK